MAMAEAEASPAPARTTAGEPAALLELIAPARTLAVVGLAKNTGKTQTLTTFLAELAVARRRVGVTSIGRDGEEHDVIDRRIAKPRVRLAAGSLVATTDALLRASAIPNERLLATGVRTPMGEVLVAETARRGHDRGRRAELGRGRALGERTDDAGAAPSRSSSTERSTAARPPRRPSPTAC